MTKEYWIEKDDIGYQVTDGVWWSAHYVSIHFAKKCLLSAYWGERGADNLGTIAGRV